MRLSATASRIHLKESIRLSESNRLFPTLVRVTWQGRVGLDVMFLKTAWTAIFWASCRFLASAQCSLTLSSPTVLMGIETRISSFKTESPFEKLVL